MTYALSVSLILPSVVLWPLVVAGILLLPGLRPAGLALTPLAALPALALSALPNGELSLPGVMLGGILMLDATGRIFLFLVSILWLASSVLARARMRAASCDTFAIMLLFAMAGSFGLVLAGDGLLFFAAATITGYSLCGALACATDRQATKAGKVLVVLLVVSDVLIFEVLLMLGQAAGSVDFESLQQAFSNSENKNVVFGLLLAGFGIKIGMLGVHFWIPPVFATANAELRPALVALIFAAGLLGVLRLTPLGQIRAPEVAAVLHWLAWATLLYTVFVGMSQNQRRFIPGYVAIALGSVWLVVLSACLQQPGRWDSLAHVSAAVLIQSGAGLAATFLMDKPNNEGVSSYSFRSLLAALQWVAVLLLGISPLGLVWAMAGHVSSITLLSVMAVIVLLGVHALLQGDNDPEKKPGERYASSAAISASRPVEFSHIAPGVVAALITVAILAAAYQLYQGMMTEAARGLGIIALAAMAAVLNARWCVLRLPVLPAGDVLLPITRGLLLVRVGVGRLLARCAAYWADITQAMDRRRRPETKRIDIAGYLESLLLSWSPALSLLLLLGLLAAWLAAL